MMQTANVFSEDEGQLWSRSYGASDDGCRRFDELAKLVLDEFSFKIRAAAESSKEGLSARILKA